MALVVVEHEEPKLEPPEVFEPPPPVAITPCDPPPSPYYLHDGLRRVRPYFFTYNTHCKARWRGRKIIEIFEDEFRDRPVEYYKNAIIDGSITLNGKQVPSIDTIVRNGDLIRHTIHRHEPPVTAQTIETIHEDEDMMVINKPAGVPVHPAGRYRHNSLVEMIRADRGLGWNPLPCHRLDRLTSGIMFLGKHKRAAEQMTEQMTRRSVKKEYVARVAGRFPDGDVICEQPVLQISPKLGLNRVRARGKPAKTVFRRLAYYPSNDNKDDWASKNESDGRDNVDGLPWKRSEGYSIVRCLPLTGRTHQLRVHLQFLGHPITNDPIYSNRKVFGHSLARGDDGSDNDEDIISRLSRMGKDEVADAIAYHDDMVDEYNKIKAEKMTGELCDVCDTPLYSDPGIHELGIYLHAKRYECAEGRWAYETPLPDWALPPPGMDGPLDTMAATDPITTGIETLSLQNTEPKDDAIAEMEKNPPSA